MSDCTHCWHETGMSSTYTFGGAGGTEGFRCCLCGIYGERKWRSAEEPIPGHGPYATRLRRVYDDEKEGA